MATTSRRVTAALLGDPEAVAERVPADQVKVRGDLGKRGRFARLKDGRELATTKQIQEAVTIGYQQGRDDVIRSGRRVKRIGRNADGLITNLEALVWSKVRRTDGFVPTGALAKLTDEPLKRPPPSSSRLACGSPRRSAGR